ncbi:hypothetical protein KP509_16G037200 [Ceratopteris richardii]|uniref:Uncharacterized protein n=1 Tax=Ceratopteris richardii TaxID=49495 RepID=A0A8T2SYT3_CERRI|nr:hypothetical protein KP509_16G037200 [Ceratopteris richardii]KAH7387701.1 hypothetical protein KP509_16G037200 [Ceratopteris richardii]
MGTNAVFPIKQLENTGFLKELQWKETTSKDEFLGNLLTDEKLSKDHIAVKTSSSSSSGGKVASKGQGASSDSRDVSKARDDPNIYTQLSINLWKRINAGYLVPRRPPTGVMRTSYTYDPALIDQQSMEFHRKRNFYSEYNEAAARFKLVHGNKKPLSKPRRVPGRNDQNGTASNEKPSTSTLPAADAGTKPAEAVEPAANPAALPAATTSESTPAEGSS